LLLLPKRVSNYVAGALVGFGVASISSFAQSAPISKAPAISPAAISMVKQSIEAYENLQSLTETIHGDLGTLKVAFNASDCFSYRMTSDYLAPTCAAEVCDGKSFLLERADDSQHYFLLPAPTEAEIPGQSDDFRYFFSVPYPGKAPLILVELVDTASDFISFKVGAPSRVDGVSVDNVYITRVGPKNQVSTQVYAFGRTDHLLRRISVLDQYSKAGAASDADPETDYNVVANGSIPSEAFALKPDAGHISGTTDQLYGDFVSIMEQGPLHTGSLAPALKVKDSDGKSVSVLPGRVTLVEFWSVQMPDGEKQMPIIASAYAKYHDQGFDVVAVSVDPAMSSDTEYNSKNPMPFPEAWPGTSAIQAIAIRYGVASMPYGVLVGKDGNVAAVDPRGALLDLAIQHALNGK